MRNYRLLILGACMGILTCNLAEAQQKVVHGVVRDAHTGEPLPFSTLQFNGSSTGTTSDENGSYTFTLPALPADSLTARTLGYTLQSTALDQTADTQTIDFSLFRQEYALKEFVIHSGSDPALTLLKLIIRHKPLNDPDLLDNYTYKLYNKLELDINRLNREKLRHSKLFRPFAFILDNMDSSAEEKPFLPVFLTETLSDYFYRRQPKKTKELILASRTSGIKNKSITQFLGTTYQNVNVYENFIPVFDKKYVSPISNAGAAYYNYHIADTQYIDNRRFFQVSFSPKRKGESAFFGDFWVHDTTYAILQVSMQVSKTANINFVGRVSLVQEFQQLAGGRWFPRKDMFVADFKPIGDKRPGLIGRKTATYDQVEINNDSAVNAVLEAKAYRDNNIYVLPGAAAKTDTFWQTHRQDTLNRREKGIYTMVDSLQHMPLFNKYSNIIQFVATGTKKFGPLEIGPYYYWFSMNDLEKYRVRFDLGTTRELLKSVYLNGYLAYGFGDRQFKGKIAGLWLLERHPRSYLYGSYTHDLDNGVQYQDQISTDNIFTLAIRKPDIPQKFVMIDEKRFEFYKEGFSGFSQHLSVVNKQFQPYAPLPDASFFGQGKQSDPLHDMQIQLSLRYAWREKFLEGSYYRVSLGSLYPIVQLDLAAGLKGVLNGQYNYRKIGLSISDQMPIPPLGSLYYNFFGGKIYGTLPYLFLEIHPGNELYYYDKYAFNMMNRYEFLSDHYAGFNLEHEIGGGIFNYLPGIRKLKLRQFWTAKGVIGGLSAANRELNITHTGYPFRTLENHPYLELGTGVENILHFIRIDCVWRVAPRPQPGEPLQKRFGVFGSFRLQF
ncbi:DUF5686 family protein [Compostibacter hankyongensis]|uniref:DUF5686 and carboxypeptidase-like regulatory domain-containing protein n=1 Tax=Compostibacter hankyongensis TaxID=1007089 RepID=A0ABP8FEH5_9BACT